MKLEYYELPIYWASALVNGDESGLTEEDQKALAKFTKFMVKVYGHCTCVDVEDDVYFKPYHDATQFGVLAADCAMYSFDVTQDS
jgi:hypothetical protein